MKLIDSALTCIHVVKKERKYEYVPEDKKTGACESFTCSECLDLNVQNPEKAMKYLQLVHKDCFIDARLQLKVKMKKQYEERCL